MSAVLEQDSHQSYDEFIQRINDRFNAIKTTVFETDATGLYEAYLASFDKGDERQYHTCSCCRQFIERFGALAVVADDGRIVSAMWSEEEAPANYAKAVSAMARIVARAKITKPFISSERQYGTAKSTVPATGHVWTHFAVKPEAARIYKPSGLTTAFAAASVKREEFGSVLHALSEYSKKTVDLALKLLQDDQLGNSAAVVGQAQFLVDLHSIMEKNIGMPLRKNLVYRAVSQAPSGFCHPRGSMIATLLDDIEGGKSFDQAQCSWNAKMHPLAYQRPQAAPTAGAIEQAERLFAAMGLAPALKRRIARLEEIPKLWEPKKADEVKSAGVFGHLQQKSAEQAPAMSAPSIAITMEKFVRTVVGTAEKMEVQLGREANFISITTAEDVDSPKLFQWDHSFAWYMWNGGAAPSQYGLQAGWASVAAVTRLPARWGDEADQKFQHHGDGIVLLIDGARETRTPGAALFPSLLRAELREVRSVIESYSNSAKMGGLMDGSAIGIDVRQGNPFNPATIRVTSAGISQIYKIDRWD